MNKVAFLMDMDGVVYRGSEPVPGAVSFLRYLQAHRHPYLLVTNNSAYTPLMLQRRLAGMGIDVPAEAIYTSALATATWVYDKGYRKVLALGEEALTEALDAAGLEVVDGRLGVDAVSRSAAAPDCIVIGELRRLDYPLLCSVVEYAAAGVPVVGTNPDHIIPNEIGIDIGCGSVVAMLERASGTKAVFVGKPTPAMFETAIARLGLSRESVVIIGDSMDTDILGAHKLGVRSVLVLSGVSTAEDSNNRPYRPDWVVEHAGEVIDLLPELAG